MDVSFNRVLGANNGDHFAGDVTGRSIWEVATYSSNHLGPDGATDLSGYRESCGGRKT